eukprot:jgi/Mesvir1/15634/Mv03239-RA.1
MKFFKKRTPKPDPVPDPPTTGHAGAAAPSSGAGGAHPALHPPRQGNVTDGHPRAAPDAKVPPIQARKEWVRRTVQGLRHEYTTSEDLRILVATWNVNGQPCDTADHLEGWIDPQEHFDLVVVGFQEVIPISAGNVLTTSETPGATAAWERLISERLNYTPPSSPDASNRPPKGDATNNNNNDGADGGAVGIDAPKDADGNGGGDGGNNQEGGSVGGTSPGGGKYNWARRRKGGERKGAAEGEDGAGATPTPMVAGDDESAGVGEHGEGGDEMATTPLDGGEQKRMRPSLSLHPDGGALFLASGGLGSPDGEGEEPVGAALHPLRFQQLLHRQMVGLHLCIWIKTELMRHVSQVQTSAVGCGILNWLGNKGAVCARFRLFKSTFCFVNCHLSSGNGPAQLARRNQDFAEIMRRTYFARPVARRRSAGPEQLQGGGGGAATAPGLGPDMQPLSILEHDVVVWLGDLNYRLDLADKAIRSGIALGDWDALLQHDQLKGAIADGTLAGWCEGPINFAPTYKFRLGTDEYVEEATGPEVGPADASDKRSPAWCDRILFRGTNMHALAYFRGESRLSDHRPVTAILLSNVLKVVPDLLAATVAKARRMFDSLESHARARIAVAHPFLDFGMTSYGDFVEGKLALANVSSVTAYFNFHAVPVVKERPHPDKEGADSALDGSGSGAGRRGSDVGEEGEERREEEQPSPPRWLRFMPSEGSLMPGEKLEVLVCMEVEGSAAVQDLLGAREVGPKRRTSHDKDKPHEREGHPGRDHGAVLHETASVDTVVILHTEGGGDAFVSITARHKLSAWGLSLDQLLRLPASVRETWNDHQLWRAFLASASAPASSSAETETPTLGRGMSCEMDVDMMTSEGSTMVPADSIAGGGGIMDLLSDAMEVSVTSKRSVPKELMRLTEIMLELCSGSPDVARSSLDMMGTVLGPLSGQLGVGSYSSPLGLHARSQFHGLGGGGRTKFARHGATWDEATRGDGDGDGDGDDDDRHDDYFDSDEDEEESEGGHGGRGEVELSFEQLGRRVVNHGAAGGHTPGGAAPHDLAPMDRSGSGNDFMLPIDTSFSSNIASPAAMGRNTGAPGGGDGTAGSSDDNNLPPLIPALPVLDQVSPPHRPRSPLGTAGGHGVPGDSNPFSLGPSAASSGHHGGDGGQHNRNGGFHGSSSGGLMASGGLSPMREYAQSEQRVGRIVRLLREAIDTGTQFVMPAPLSAPPPLLFSAPSSRSASPMRGARTSGSHRGENSVTVDNNAGGSSGDLMSLASPHSGLNDPFQTQGLSHCTSGAINSTLPPHPSHATHPATFSAASSHPLLLGSLDEYIRASVLALLSFLEAMPVTLVPRPVLATLEGSLGSGALTGPPGASGRGANMMGDMGDVSLSRMDLERSASGVPSSIGSEDNLLPPGATGSNADWSLGGGGGVAGPSGGLLRTSSLGGGWLDTVRRAMDLHGVPPAHFHCLKHVLGAVKAVVARTGCPAETIGTLFTNAIFHSMSESSDVRDERRALLLRLLREA